MYFIRAVDFVVDFALNKLNKRTKRFMERSSESKCNKFLIYKMQDINSFTPQHTVYVVGFDEKIVVENAGGYRRSFSRLHFFLS